MNQPLKVLVFAHVPPPVHGQSVMVQAFLDSLPEDPLVDGIHCFHVDCRVSSGLADIGGIRPGKLLRLAGYCLRALWLRFRHGIEVFYYVPAPAKRSAILRDWIVMGLVRPWFPKIVLHWHAYGLGHWVCGRIEHPAGSAGPEISPPCCFGPADIAARHFTGRLLGNADVSIVLTEYNRSDAELLQPRKVFVVSNGIPDPCPDFERTVLPRRVERALGRERLEVLFLAHCTRAKGLFDAVEAAVVAAKEFPVRLTVAGEFLDDEERKAFERRAVEINRDPRCQIRYAGFLDAYQKSEALRESDLLCFPTAYSGEGLPVSIIEALAFGLPIVATSWRGIPEMLPASLPSTVSPGDVPSLAAAIVAAAAFRDYSSLRQRYLENHALAQHTESLCAVFRAVAVSASGGRE